MDYPIKEKKRSFTKYPKTDLDLAYAFSKEIYKECGQIIKAIVLFGSTARQHPDARIKDKEHHDVDILIVLDDVHIELSKELAETYKIISEKIIAKVSPRIHVTTLKLSTFWEYVRVGDPLAINMLRDGVALVDTGFFDPLQGLLRQGRIRPTPESVWQYFARAPNTLNNSRWHILQATLDLYWAVIDASHAVLMYYDQVPPSPAHVADLLEEVAVKKHGVLQQKHVKTMRQFYNLFKGITHRDIGDISGEQYEQYYAQAKAYVTTMQNIIETTPA